MIVLDTNVISEVMRREPEMSVLAWLDSQSTSDLYITAVAIGEIAYGLAVLALGQRRQDLEERFEQFVETGFAHRILPYGDGAARLYGRIMGERRRSGRPINALDCQIASIAREQGFAVATRNTRDFEGCGISVINPFGLG